MNPAQIRPAVFALKIWRGPRFAVTSFAPAQARFSTVRRSAHFSPAGQLSVFTLRGIIRTAQRKRIIETRQRILTMRLKLLDGLGDLLGCFEVPFGVVVGWRVVASFELTKNLEGRFHG